MRVVSLADVKARLSAVLVAFFPSLVAWSSLNLKDADVFFLVLAGLLLAVQMEFDLWLPLRFLGIGVILVALFSLRQFAAELLALAAVVALVSASPPARWLGSWRHPWLMVGVPVTVLVAATLAVGVAVPRLGAWMYMTGGLEQLAHIRHELGVGARSVTNADPGIGTLAGALRFLPSGMVDFMLRPFPWEPGSELASLTRPETVLYYLLLLPAALGALIALRQSPGRAIPLVTYLVIGALGYGLVISNLGTLYRERAPLQTVIFVFVGVAVGMLRRSEREQVRRGRPLSDEVVGSPMDGRPE